MKIYDLIIIGGGAAGYTAALYACRAGLDTLVIERLSAGGQMALTGEIDNYPGFDEGIDGFTLGMKMQSQAERFGAVTEYADVISVDFSKPVKKITASSGEFLSKTVAVATGANPKELGLENEREFIGKGIHYCAHCDGRFYKDKTVAVVGGGNSAVTDALYLSRIAKKVYLIHRRDTLSASKIYTEPLLKADNVEFLWNSSVTELITDDRVRGVRLQDKELICDALFISIGRTPATDFLKNAVQLDANGYIIADETTKTDIDGVYAIGDVRTKPLRQIVTAVSDGAVCVEFAERFCDSVTEK